MRLTIHHRTDYLYDDPVVLEPHVLRLIPRTDFSQKLLHRTFKIDPVPSLQEDFKYKQETTLQFVKEGD